MKNKKIFNIIIIIGVTAMVMYILLRDQFDSIMNEIININVFWLLLAIFLMFGYLLFRSIILHTISKKFKDHYRFRRSFRIQILTLFFNSVTPFASGGQPFQIYALKKEGIKYSDGTNIVIQQFIIFQIPLVLLGLFALIYNQIFNVFKEVNILNSLVALGFVVNFLVIATLFALTYIKKFDEFILKFIINILSKFGLIKHKHEVLEKWNNQIDNFNKVAKDLVKNKKEYAYLLLLSIISQISLYVIPCAILYGMGDFNSINTTEAIIASAYVMLIGSFIPTPGSTGGLEYAFLVFFGNFIKGPSLSAAMLVWRFITYYLGMIIGAFVLNMKGRK